ncbi:trypsin-like peptidase domain-containing protein [Streptomyces beigongshangae]|uniref:VMAP-C domain-containing protein n=1 Tax=Streptomyces beigongshangae TaxID=2841597 RepID=UPI001C84A2A5|nr:trypsin-like peptidase domain-containing protein [Streptomyces sp. REN17]
MGWFHDTDGPASVDPRRSVVSVLRRHDGRTAGAGVLLGADRLLTCAHVVNDALDRPPFEVRAPGHPVEVILHGATSTTRYDAVVVHWVPPRRTDGGPRVREREDREWAGDLAVLRIESPPGDHAPAPRWQPMSEGQALRAWHSTGLRSSFADVHVKSCDDTIGYLDGEGTGMPIGPAYSGGPLWEGAGHAVVGIVAAHIMPPADPATGRAAAYSTQHIARRSWGIPWQRIRSELRAVGADRLFDLPAVDPDDPAPLLLADLLESTMPSPMLRTEYAAAVAERCGLGHRTDASAPTFEEFAHLLVLRPRALPALTEVLRRRDPGAADQLLAAGLLSRTPKLLSPREHRKLWVLLRAVPAPVTARFPEAVRAALPLAAEFPPDNTLDGLLDRLESLPGDSRTETGGPRVPGLLRVMEYFAVLCQAAPRAGFRLWVDAVAGRLGIPRSALAERRSDAEDWARALGARTAPLRVLVQVTGDGDDRYRLRMWCDEGAGPRRLPVDGGTAHSGAEGARELLRVLESLYRAAPDDRRPLVEALVDRAGLNLPIDEWESLGSDDLVPGVLGAEYPIIVNCPELLRRNERFLPDWRRRWRQLDSGVSLRFGDDATSPREVYGTLMDRRDAVRVSVDAPPRLRDGIVQVCLAVGVPVVVWDRGAGREPHAVDHMTGATTRDLPEAVRSYRAKTVHRPRDFPGRPVLAWADADRTVPRLHLSEPREGR